MQFLEILKRDCRIGNTVKKYVRLAEQHGLDLVTLTSMADHELEKLF